MTARQIPITRIATKAEWQVRNRLDSNAITRYAANYRNGDELPPITLVDIDGALLLVDGWHRLAAAEKAGLCVVSAEVVEATPKEALWLAAKANMANGVPLKRSEFRNVFRALVKAGEYQKGRRSLSYREISKKLGGQVAHTTIRNWMKEDFPAIAETYGPAEPHGNALAGAPPIPAESALGIALEHLHSLGAIRDGLSPQGRATLAEAMRHRLGSDFEEPETFDL